MSKFQKSIAFFEAKRIYVSVCPKPVRNLPETYPKPARNLSLLLFAFWLFGCPKPVRNLPEACPKLVRTKTQKTDYPLRGYGSSILFPSYPLISLIIVTISPVLFNSNTAP